MPKNKMGKKRVAPEVDQPSGIVLEFVHGDFLYIWTTHAENNGRK
jgi:hypothetical protein